MYQTNALWRHWRPILAYFKDSDNYSQLIMINTLTWNLLKEKIRFINLPRYFLQNDLTLIVLASLAGSSSLETKQQNYYVRNPWAELPYLKAFADKKKKNHLTINRNKNSILHDFSKFYWMFKQINYLNIMFEGKIINVQNLSSFLTFKVIRQFMLKEFLLAMPKKPYTLLIF